MDMDKIAQEAVVVGSIEGDAALEMIALIRKQEAALRQSQSAYGALAMELAATKVTHDALVAQMKEIARYDSSEGYAAMRALTAAGVTL